MIELLIVIAIIGVLAALLLPTFGGAQKRPYDLAAVQCGRAVLTAETTYRIERQTFTNDLTALGEDVREACQNQGVRLSVHANTQADPNGAVQAWEGGPSNLAFKVFHPSGSGYYRYWTTSPTPLPSGDRLNRLFKWG